MSLTRPPDPGSKDRDLILCPPDGVVEVSVECRVGREHQETHGEGLGNTGQQGEVVTLASQSRPMNNSC